jgi:peptidoglycan-associated lipoprotein
MQLEFRSAALTRIAVAAPIAVVLALAACANKPVVQSAPSQAPVVTATQTPVGNAGQPAPTAPSIATPLSAAAYLDPNSPIFQQRSVWFAYDNDALRPQDKAVVELQGRYLAQHPDVRVTVAGNTDERGGSEYNLALGQRRAQSVKSALAVLGVKDAHVEATSYGKEKPKATGHDEAAWQQNRRADFLYPSS